MDQKRITIKFQNFKADNSIVLTGGPVGSSTIFSGQADVQTNGKPKWNNVSASIIIDRFDTISIALDSRTTDNHFNGQPVTGIVESVKSPEGTELIVVDVDIPASSNIACESDQWHSYVSY